MSEGDTYAPQSPDLSAYQSAQPSIQSPSYSYGNPPSHHQSHFQSPYFPAQVGQPLTAYPSNHSASPYQQHYQQQGFGHSTPNNMPRRSRAEAGFDDEGMAGPSSSANSKLPKKQRGEEEFTRPTPGSSEGIEVKTKFPVARIKRIMQADDDVGKVAQVTPTAVSKALELFMISLVTKAATEARTKSAKKVTAAHLKKVIMSDKQFDFLESIVAKVPDAPAPKKDDDSEGHEGSKKRKAAPRRRKKEEDSS